MSAPGLGRVKTPKLNLRIEISSRLRQFEKQKLWRPLLGEDNSIELAIAKPPQKGKRVRIFNQMTETFKVIDLAEMISRMTGVAASRLANPRKEADSNDLCGENRGLIALGLKPITLNEGLLREISDVAKKYTANCDRSKIPSISHADASSKSK